MRNRAEKDIFHTSICCLQDDKLIQSILNQFKQMSFPIRYSQKRTLDWKLMLQHSLDKVKSFFLYWFWQFWAIFLKTSDVIIRCQQLSRKIMTVSYKEFNCLKFLLLQARGVYGSNNIPGLSVRAGNWGWWFPLATMNMKHT